MLIHCLSLGLLATELHSGEMGIFIENVGEIFFLGSILDKIEDVSNKKLHRTCERMSGRRKN